MPDPAPTQLIPQTDGELELAQIKDFLADKCHLRVGGAYGRTTLDCIKQMRGDLVATVKIANRTSLRASRAEAERDEARVKYDVLRYAISDVHRLLTRAFERCEGGD